jgi:uncharacterized damage-inducible protein DinB
MSATQPEPWLRGTHPEIPAVPRAVVHALELAAEDLQTWCGHLSDQEFHATPANLPSIAFQIRHIVRSVDRLLTYAEDAPLNSQQLAALATESETGASRNDLFDELRTSLHQSTERICKLGEVQAALEKPRTVGRKNLPTTVAGLLIHIADHTQRHVGQAITTAKLLRAQGP